MLVVGEEKQVIRLQEGDIKARLKVRIIRADHERKKKTAIDLENLGARETVGKSQLLKPHSSKRKNY